MDITAKDFCKFFDYELVKETGLVPNLETGAAEPYEYVAVDAQGTCSPKYVNNVEELADCFDMFLEDYVDETLEYHGFSYTTSADEVLPPYYVQAKGWIENSYPELLDTETYKVVCALASQGKTIKAGGETNEG